ncbi:hypothetical protein A0O34_07070 [Chryseobacterium glaciei]|uniref:Uncharacterized protein n=1 Tax=Chryseobacterium glaciei TaxID=1685010 RepID=A0A172XTT7_9FLAO|nr:hypothetical protein [Chryseobacterium glaciei]ANF50290.1 hypothetical protein A0O34_07070 [Chryseobacterium glaciei]
MSYAQTYPIGETKNTRRKTAKTTSPTVDRVRPPDEKDKRFWRNPKGQTKVCSHQPASNGFLRTTFLPRLKETETVPPCQRIILKMEMDFYKSLSQMAKHYDVEPRPTNDFEYPYNMAFALSDIEQKLKNKVIHWDAVRLVQDKKKTYFISEERYKTGSTLYYIPVVPLYTMLKDKSRKKIANLILSVFSYLYHIADIPYYRQENSYLYWQYEMLTDWVEEDEENDDTDHYKLELQQAKSIGDAMEQKLFNPINLQRFEQRINTIIPKDEFEGECLKMAVEAYQLYQEYPSAGIFRNAQRSATDPEEEDENGYEDDENRLTMDKYISFYADSKGSLSDNLYDTVNNEFNEYGEIQEPAISKCFDGRPITDNTLDFEIRLFTLLDNLIYLLNNYKIKNNE